MLTLEYFQQIFFFLSLQQICFFGVFSLTVHYSSVYSFFINIFSLPLRPSLILEEQPAMNNQPKSSKSTINIALAVIHITETGETHSSFKIRWVQLKIINQNQPLG
jgi:hypothetical protein